MVPFLSSVSSSALWAASHCSASGYCRAALMWRGAGVVQSTVRGGGCWRDCLLSLVAVFRRDGVVFNTLLVLCAGSSCRW